MTYRLLDAGRYRFGSEVVDVTPFLLRQMRDNTPVPFPLLVRHDATKVCGTVTRLFIHQNGLWATIEDLALVPAFSTDPPMIQEVSVTGVQMIQPDT
jgi:hypothetical protein